MHRGRSSCKLHSRLVVAAGGSLHFGCRDTASRRIRSRGHAFRTFAVYKNIFCRSIRAKNAIRNLRRIVGKYRMVFLCRECLQAMNIVNVMLHMSDGKHNNNNTSNKKARSKNSPRNAVINANIWIGDTDMLHYFIVENI